MPGPGVGFTANDHILWTQRVNKENRVNACVRKDGFSVRAAVRSEGVPSSFKPGHLDPAAASEKLDNAFDPSSAMEREFRQCMSAAHAGPRERQVMPETTQQDLGWSQTQAGDPTDRSLLAGKMPRVGIGWNEKPAGDAVVSAAKAAAKPAAPQPRARPPFASYSPEAARAARDLANSRRAAARRRERTASGLTPSSSKADSNAPSTSHMPHSSSLPILGNEEALSSAMQRSRSFLNRNPKYKWYKPLSNSDVAEFADAYTKSWGVQLYQKKQAAT